MWGNIFNFGAEPKKPASWTFEIYVRENYMFKCCAGDQDYFLNANLTGEYFITERDSLLESVIAPMCMCSRSRDLSKHVSRRCDIVYNLPSQSASRMLLLLNT